MATEILIVGAGPTGLVLALWLGRIGIRVRIIDRNTGPGTASRALVVQARTLELYRQLDLADAVIARGHKAPAINLWVRGKHARRISFHDVGQDLTRYASIEIFPQDEHELLLIERLRALGVEVEWQTELLHFSDDGAEITARLKKTDGGEEACKASYIAGCDGAGSTVRKVLGIEFGGGTYQDVFYVADIQGSGPAINGELHIDLDSADFLAVFPQAETERARLVGAINPAHLSESREPTYADIDNRVVEQLQIKIAKVNWFSTYHVHHRVAGNFRAGRAFLLGDAAHIHSPVGGQGMNTGILDAINLAWKLSAVLSGNADDALLDSYEVERMGFARQLVATTDRAFSLVAADGPLARIMRTRIIPAVLSAALSFKIIREYLFRTVSQLKLNYRDMPLSAGRAGNVAGGDRLPWVVIGGNDNHDPLTVIHWQVHVYGIANHALTAWCRETGLPLHCFPWHPAYGQAGLAQDALYLIRPDTYVALAAPSGSVHSLKDYFSEHGIRSQNRVSF